MSDESDAGKLVPSAPATPAAPAATPEPPSSAVPEEDVKMTIWEHLGELRTRVVRAAIGLFLCACVAWNFHVKLLAFLVVPYEKMWHDRFPAIPLELQTLSPGDAFVGYMQLSIVAGGIAAAPIIFYQLWAFISPGLYAREKRFIYPFVIFSTTLFGSGVAFAYYVAMPFMYRYFLSLLGPVTEGGAVLTQRPTLEYYVDLSTRMLLVFGLVFELPLLIGFLALAGIVTPKQLVKFGRWAILIAFIVGAIVSPGPEVTLQLIASGVIIGLYFVSIGVAFVVAKKPPKNPAADADAPSK